MFPPFFCPKKKILILQDVFYAEKSIERKKKQHFEMNRLVACTRVSFPVTSRGNFSAPR